MINLILLPKKRGYDFKIQNKDSLTEYILNDYRFILTESYTIEFTKLSEYNKLILLASKDKTWTCLLEKKIGYPIYLRLTSGNQVHDLITDLRKNNKNDKFDYYQKDYNHWSNVVLNQHDLQYLTTYI